MIHETLLLRQEKKACKISDNTCVSNVLRLLFNILFLAEYVEQSSTTFASKTIASSVDGETKISRTVMQSSTGGAMESNYESASSRGKNVAISEAGEHLISERQITRTLNTSIGMDKAGSLAVTGGKPFFTKPLVGRSVERKCCALIMAFLPWFY